MRRQHGISLIELVISIVIIGIAAAGILTVMNVTTRTSADPMIEHQAVAIAEAYLEEIVSKSYSPQPGTGARANYDDVDDYSGLVDVGAHDQLGVAIAGLGDYTISVVVHPAASVSGQLMKRIDVTVTNGTLISVTLSGYRANYS